MRRLAILAVAVYAVTSGPAGPTAGAVDVPGTSCRVFPANNVWHLDVSGLPVHANNAPWKRSTHAGSTLLHPDFGPPSYGIPFDVVASSHPNVSISFRYGGESDPGPYPFGPDTDIEGGSDRHAIMIDEGTCTLYELYAARWNGGDPSAGSGAIFGLEGPRANDLRPAGWTSADAAGLPIFPGLARWDEAARGVIDHALRFTAAETRRAYVYPARHYASSSNDPSLPPMGLRVRLKATVNVASFPKQSRIVLRALQRYGMILADNGSPWYISGAPNRHWSNDQLHSLGRLTGADFEVVDTSSLPHPR
jgi:hypothetical protein